MFFRRAQAAERPAQITVDGAGLTGTDADRRRRRTAQEGGWYQRPTGDARRSALNTNDLRGKVLRIKVKDDDIAAADANKADFGSGTGAYTIPAGQPVPARRAARRRRKTRPEVYAMGFRNPFRIQVDENDVAYVTDYSPDAQHAAARSAARPASAASRSSASRPTTAGRLLHADLAYYQWNFHEFAPGTTTAGTPLDNPPQPYDCGGPTQRERRRAGT